jgi:hypothetical protein
MSWPPVWEGTFVEPAKARTRDPAREAAYARRIADEVHYLASARLLSPEQKDAICWVLFNIDYWASSLARDLRKCPWKPLDQLRGPMPPLKTDAERKKWERCRWHYDAYSACWATRQAIVDGDWIDAISWAMQAGNLLTRDKAATGRARGAALSNPNKRTANADRLAKRNALILQAADDMRLHNSTLTDSSIATHMAGRTINGMTLPKAETIRKILRSERNLGRFDASSQP